MLVLSRKEEEKIMIGDKVSIQVLEVCGNHVKLGFSAPRDISIYRQEIYQKIQKNTGYVDKDGEDYERD